MQSRLGRWILVLLLVSQVGTIGGLIALSRHEGNQLVADRSSAVLQSNADDAQRRLESHLFPAETLLRYATNFLEVDSASPELLEGTFFQSLVDVPQLAGAFVGDEDGNFFYVSRVPEGIRVKTIANDADRTVTVVLHSFDGTIISEEQIADDPYDPRTRPWYGLAVTAAGEPEWTDPYVFFTSQNLGITVAQAVITDGQQTGVVGVDMELASLTEFLRELRPPDQGEAAMIDLTSATVLARSRADDSAERNDSGQELLVGDDGSPLGTLVARIPSAQGDLVEFDNNAGETVRAAIRSVDVGTQSWTVAVLGTEDEVVPELASAEDREQGLQMLVGALSVLVTIAIALPIIRPVHQLEIDATTDVLTQLPNRRSIMAAARSMSASSSPHAFAMIDIDSFKGINDEFGHQVGDEVLSEVARRLTHALEPGDRIGRIGGEEFVALIRGESAQAVVVAMRMLQTVRETPVVTTEGLIPVTVSIGLATAPELSDEIRLLADADHAMLTSKAAGRDQLTVHAVDLSDGVRNTDPVG